MSLTLLPEPLRGAARPRVEVRPPGIVDSHLDDAADLWARAGLELDGWQRDGLDLMLGLQPDGLWSCKTYCEWVPRQNGKSAGLLTPRALLGFLVLGEQLILWSSHKVDTTMRSFKFVDRVLRKLGKPQPGKAGEYFIDFPADGFTVKVNWTHSHEGFERLDTRAELKFVSRSDRGGRGMDPECLILDEAFALTSGQMEAQAPATAAQPNAQIIMTSTPPLDGVSGEVMFDMRDRAASADPGRLGSRDWGLKTALDELLAAPADERRVFLEDRGNWSRSNPSLGAGRLGEPAILELRRLLTDEGFARECLGMWPARGAESKRLISAARWGSTEQPEAILEGVPVFGVDVNPQRTLAAIGAAGLRTGGGVLVELPPPVRDADPDDEWPIGIDWVVARAKELDASHGPTLWAGDTNGPAKALLLALEREGLNVVRVTGPDFAGACTGFYDVPPFHRIDPVLDDAIEALRKRDIGDGSWAFGRKNSGANIAPAVAVAVARHVLLVHGAPNVPSPVGVASQSGSRPETADLTRIGF